jgi:hypothetical protein
MKNNRINEIIRKLDSDKYRLYSHSGKNLGTYDTRAGAEKRERQVQYFKHATEQNNVGHPTALTNPQYTVVIDTPGELDWYKIGQHFPTLAQEPSAEFKQSESDMTITLANQEELDKLKSTLSKLGISYKDISGSHEHPEIHSENFQGNKMKEQIDKFNPEDPLASSIEVQGYGVMNLNSLMKNIAGTIKDLAKMREDPLAFRNLKHTLYDNSVLRAKVEAVVTALDQLQDIKRKGGKRSVNIQREADQVRGSEPMPKKQRPSSGPNSPHPYKNRLVGEAETLPIDLNLIANQILELEVKRIITSEQADDLRREVRNLATERKTLEPEAILQYLTMLSKR